MTTINKHQCPSCGGNLTVDNDKQMYRCTSCGSSYDFDYFREEKLSEMGKTHLSRKEFAAAVDTYRLILKKSPHDFYALRGLMFAAANLKDIDGLVKAGNKNHFTYNSPMVREVLDNASEENTGYFEDFARIYYNLNRLSNCNTEIRALTNTKKQIDQTIALEEQETYNYKISTGYYSGKNPMEVFIAHWVIALVLLIVLLCIVIPSAVLGDGIIALVAFLFFGFFIGLTAVVNMKLIYPEVQEEKELKAYIQDLHNESELIGPRIRKLEAEAEDLSADIRASIQDFIEKDALMMADSVKEQAPVVSTIKKHQCPSCGGSLRIDSDKQMYHCTFCGSTYDYEYFREDRIHEMGETYLSRGEFMATADAYDFMLQKDPHDFVALRGSMLAAAHMTSMSELDLDIEKLDFSFDLRMVKRAIESASEEDKPYFKELARIYSERKKMIELKEELKALYEKKENINSVIAHNNLSRNNYYLVDKDGVQHLPKVRFIIVWVITAISLLYTCGFGLGLIESIIKDPDSINIALGLFIPFLFISLGLIAYNYSFIYSKIRKLKKCDKANAELYVEVGKMDKQIKDLENASAETMKDIRRSIHDFVREDRIKMDSIR